MILVRTGGIFGLLIAATVAALFLFVVRPAINDTTQPAFDSADRVLDETSRQLDRIDAGGDYLSPASFAVVTQIKRELGSDAELLDLTVSEQGGGNVKYRTGDRAAGFQWGPGHEASSRSRSRSSAPAGSPTTCSRSRSSTPPRPPS
jgi:hypothetical protein